VRILSKKLVIAMMAVSMAVFPALRANAQAGAGGIAGVSATIALIVCFVVIGAVAASNYNDSGRPNTFPAIPSVPSEEPTATTTTTDGGSTTTTTTTN